jgi:uncharacterized protein
VREIWRERVWKARPYVVVHDRPEQVALYLPCDSVMKIPPGSGIPRDQWRLEDVVVEGTDTLRLTRPGEPHSVLLFWHDGAFNGWYVNFERPVTRAPLGFDYLDHELDLLVRPDGTTELLDEDEFEEAQRVGVIEPDEAAEVLAELARVRGAVERWESPFCDGWETWRPDPAWPVPQLPAGWDAVDSARS